MFAMLEFEVDNEIDKLFKDKKLFTLETEDDEVLRNTELPKKLPPLQNTESDLQYELEQLELRESVASEGLDKKIEA